MRSDTASETARARSHRVQMTQLRRHGDRLIGQLRDRRRETRNAIGDARRVFDRLQTFTFDHTHAPTQTQTKLWDLERQQAFLLTLADAIRPIDDPAEIQRVAGQCLATHVRVDQVEYSDTIADATGPDGDPDQRSLVVGRVRPQDFGERLVAILRSGTTGVCGDVAADPRIRHAEGALFARAEVAAFIAVPLVKAGVWVATLAAYSREPRTWIASEIAAVEETATRTWAAVERARAEAALRESEAHLAKELEDARVLQKISNELVSEAGPNGHYYHIVEVARTLMRSDAASIQALDAADSRLTLLAHTGFHPESAAFWAYVDADLGSSCGRALNAQTRVVVPDMHEFEADPHDVAAYRKSGIMSVQSTPLVASSGRIVGMLSTHWNHPHTPSADSYRFFDILARLAADFMERARAEAALRASEAKYRALFESMGQGYSAIEMIHGPDGRPIDHRLIELNPAFERLTGIRITDAIGRTATEVTPEMDPWWFETYDRIAHQGYPERVEYELTALGRWYEAHCFPQGGERLIRI